MARQGLWVLALAAGCGTLQMRFVAAEARPAAAGSTAGCWRCRRCFWRGCGQCREGRPERLRWRPAVRGSAFRHRGLSVRGLKFPGMSSRVIAPVARPWVKGETTLDPSGASSTSGSCPRYSVVVVLTMTGRLARVSGTWPRYSPLLSTLPGTR